MDLDHGKVATAGLPPAGKPEDPARASKELISPSTLSEEGDALVGDGEIIPTVTNEIG
jgi:hypothetical protein